MYGNAALKAEVVDFYEYIQIKEAVQVLVQDFLCDSLEKFIEDAYWCFEMAEMDKENGREGNLHMTVYWIEGIADISMDFIKEHYKAYGSYLYNEIQERYKNKVGMIKELEIKVKKEFQSGDYEAFVAYHCLCTLVLKRYQTRKEWQVIYGIKHKDYCDLERTHHISNALDDYEEFPLIETVDIAGAMIGVCNYVQPTDLYDVFARVADKYQRREDGLLSLSNVVEAAFTPEAIQLDAIIARYKRYNKLRIELKGSKKKKDSEIQRCMFELGSEGAESPEDFVWFAKVIHYVKNAYLERYSALPESLPLPKNCIDVEYDYKRSYSNLTPALLIRVKLQGFCKGILEWKTVYEKKHSMPMSAHDVVEFMQFIAADIKKEITGMEKERNGDTSAYPGQYPRRETATHGLKLDLDNMPFPLIEKQTTFIIKQAVKYSTNLGAACSFGADSTLFLYFLRQITNDFKVIFNYSRNEYRETMEFKNFLIEEWDLKDKLITTLPEMTMWEFNEEYGFNFEKKAGRSKGQSNSEKCCYLMKHAPAMKAYKEHKIDTVMTGLRADESVNRLLAGLRDGVVYISTSWNVLKVNPILFWTDQMVWDFIKGRGIPYSKLYDMVLYNEDGTVKYRPRTGCLVCMVTSAYGYLSWLKHFYPKAFWFVMKEKGLGVALFRIAHAKQFQSKQGNCTTKQNAVQMTIDELLSEAVEAPEQSNEDDIEIDLSEINWELIESILLDANGTCYFEKALLNS